jgi:hypothetical protein
MFIVLRLNNYHYEYVWSLPHGPEVRIGNWSKIKSFFLINFENVETGSYILGPRLK